MKNIIAGCLLGLSLISCGKQSHELEISDSTQTVEGGTKSYFTIVFEPLAQIGEICGKAYLKS